jgi:hypothetical protein
MSKLSWVTPIGNIANIPVGVDINTKLQTVDLSNVTATVTYSIISGTLPPGLTLSPAGLLSGTTTNPAPNNSNAGNVSFNFIVRAIASTGSHCDGAFNIVVSTRNVNIFQWITAEGNLGTVPDSEFYSLQLTANDSLGSAITYKILSGQLPGGMRLTTAGVLQGVPTILNPVVVDSTETYRFTVRATNAQNKVIDRGFNLTVTNVFGPIIEPVVDYLGAFFDGAYFTQQLTVIEPNPAVQIQWSITEGSLPPGLTLSSTGLISGYLLPIQLTGDFGPQGYDGYVEENNIITEEQRFSLGPYDFNNVNQSVGYKFTVRAFDGANYDLQTYSIDIIARTSLSADSTLVINNSYITIDSNKYYLPILLDSSTTLPTARQDSYYAYKFKGYDPQGFQLTYSLVNQAGTFDAGVPGVDNGFDYYGGGTILPGVGFDSVGLIGNDLTSNLPGLVLDASTGWLYGRVDPQVSAIENYTFTLQVSKTTPAPDSIVVSSDPVVFTLPVLGDINNTITWITPENLGTIDNGTVSELSVRAASTEGKPLTYTLLDMAGFPCRLPQGLTLTEEGDIAGRVTFQSFSLDNYTTTIDGGSLTIDRTYNFYVEVSAVDGTVSSLRQFTVKLNVIDTEPHNNLYLKALPAYDQRQIYNSIISNTDIFDPALIYRKNDPWFGVRNEIKMIFATGLTTTEIDNYANAIIKNHWIKSYEFGDIKTASVLDEFYQPKYEVVYISMLDPEENASGVGPGLSVDLTNTITNPYISQTGDEYKIIYPNTSDNMLSRLDTGVGYSNKSTLPAWMTSNQPVANSTTFNPPLGYTKGVVLAYTIPGASKLIAYRLKNSGINFNKIQFTVDRYEVDNYYSENFDYSTRSFRVGTETTFDRTPRAVGAIVAEITYAVTGVPFDQINGRPINYVVGSGGIDGITTFKTGDTLIFAQQEQYPINEPFDGWGVYTDAYIGDNVLTPAIEGYASEPFDNYTIIPGFLEKAQNNSIQNQRAGIWRVVLVGANVTLEFVREVDVNQRVKVVRGSTYGGAVLYYNPTIPAGQTVPSYTIYKVTPPSVDPKTTFNAGTTRFFSYKDQYYLPGTQDKYLKFPQDGAFK